MTDPAHAPSMAPFAAASDRPLEVRLAEACMRSPIDLSPAGIVAALQGQAPGTLLRYGMARAGWHRLGGVVDQDLRPVARHLREWAEAQGGEDVDFLLKRCAELEAARGGFVTRLEGCTHYITALTGERARDFIQIEIEQVQEVVERRLWDPERLPDDLEDFIDPADFTRLAPRPVGPPRLLFRRLLRVSEFVASEDAGGNLKRFLADWDRSSAGEGTRFADHWILSVQEYRDTQGDGRLTAKPVPLPGADRAELPDEIMGPAATETGGRIPRGAALANLIHGFDRQLGYHFAWFFHMLSRRRVSYRLAEAVHADLMGAFDYLPARDIAVLRDWHDAPYSA